MHCTKFEMTRMSVHSSATKHLWEHSQHARSQLLCRFNDGSDDTALLSWFLQKIRSVRILDTIVCSWSLVWLFSPARDAVKLILPGCWLHLSFRGYRPYRFRSDDCSCSELAPGLMFENFLPIPDAESLPFYSLVLKLVVCESEIFHFFLKLRHQLISNAERSFCENLCTLPHWSLLQWFNNLICTPTLLVQVTKVRSNHCCQICSINKNRPQNNSYYYLLLQNIIAYYYVLLNNYITTYYYVITIYYYIILLPIITLLLSIITKPLLLSHIFTDTVFYYYVLLQSHYYILLNFSVITHFWIIIS